MASSITPQAYVQGAHADTELRGEALSSVWTNSDMRATGERPEHECTSQPRSPAARTHAQVPGETSISLGEIVTLAEQTGSTFLQFLQEQMEMWATLFAPGPCFFICS